MPSLQLQQQDLRQPLRVGVTDFSDSLLLNNPAAPLPLSPDDRNTLEKWEHSATAPYRVVTRAKALLMAGDGVANSRIATTLGIGRPTVLDWRARFRT